MTQLAALLAASGMRLTAPRQKLFAVLEASDTPLSIRDILAAEPSLDRTSLYRSLEVFITLGIAEVVPMGWKQRYELASPFKPHHHHMQCTSCHELIRLDHPQLEQYIHDLAASYDYQLTSHHIELQGICKGCQSPEA